MTARRKATEDPAEPTSDETPPEPAAPTPPAPEDPSPPPAGPDPVVQPPAAPPSPPAEPAAAPPADLGTQIAVAMKAIHEDDAHRKEHDALAAATKVEPPKPKGLLDKLRWGS